MPRPAAPHDPVDLGPLARPVRRSLNGDHPGETGTALPALIDHHVHLEMVHPERLPGGGIAGVVDLGANPAVVARLAAADGLPAIRFAGQFLTAPGGYPGGRWWLRDGSLREVPAGPPPAATGSLPGPAELAVDEQAVFGASVVKVVLNADAGPVFDDATLAAIVRAAHERGLGVAVHAEGDGTARRAIDAGADVLVHTPWTEALPDELLASAAAAAGQAWISTLDIHARDGVPGDLDRAVSNLRRFREAGGRVLYGTDLGNGDLPDGVNGRELDALVAAGLDAHALIEALTDPWPAADREAWGLDGVVTFVAGPPPATLAEVPAWLAGARLLPAEELEELDP
ncbi:amidohydrolase family protein [Agromyces sp. G08B096]|uniref:Amidohydrolase family protein n=1 Tax=Agromyces sp. G08B096 TaxID=3156399 RepID=A0AAU7W903_9MICO